MTQPEGQKITKLSIIALLTGLIFMMVGLYMIFWGKDSGMGAMYVSLSVIFFAVGPGLRILPRQKKTTQATPEIEKEK